MTWDDQLIWKLCWFEFPRWYLVFHSLALAAPQPCRKALKFSRWVTSSHPQHPHHFTTSLFPTLALLSKHLRLWAGTRRSAIHGIRNIMTISNDSPASMAAESLPPSISSNSDASPLPRKKLHGRAFYESIGSPKFVLAPMVDQSEFVLLHLSQ
jgi:hypothetical protein